MSDIVTEVDGIEIQYCPELDAYVLTSPKLKNGGDRLLAPTPDTMRTVADEIEQHDAQHPEYEHLQKVFGD